MTMTWRATHMPRRLSISSVLFDDAACNPHTVSSYFFSSVLFDNAVCNPHAVSSFFSSVLFDEAACNPHAMSSISFPQCCLTMRHATHTPHHLFLFLSVV